MKPTAFRLMGYAGPAGKVMGKLAGIAKQVSSVVGQLVIRSRLVQSKGDA